MTRAPRLTLAIVLLSLVPVALAAPQLVVQLPADAKVASAVASAPKLKLDTPGKAEGAKVLFPNLLPDTAYDVKITLADGTVLAGASLDWYTDEAADKEAGPMDEEDRQQINDLVAKPLAFTNNNRALALRGDHDRAVALVQLVRDTAFHSSKGDEVIWRVELWYFKNRNGGWEHINQTNKILRRERYATSAQYRAATDKLRWIPDLGGIKLGKDEATKTLVLASTNPLTTRPAKE